MKKPHLSDFNLDKNSLREQQRKRRRLKPLMILFALLVLIANYYFWLWVRIIIGNWSIFGLFLTLWGILPAVFSYVLLDIFLGRFLYAGLKPYEDAKEKYDKWFLRTQTAFWDALTGRQFEIEVASLLNRSGYSAKVTPASNDKGVDLMLSDGTIIQCKAHKSRVSPLVARELYGTLKHFEAPGAILISKGGFSKGVYEFVTGKNIKLWDLSTLIKMQKELET